MLGTTAQLAQVTGARMISVDYTVAPAAKWEQITDQIIAVVKALKQEGYPLGRIAMFGDSAGGNLAAAVTLKMRDEGIGMPAAVVLWSAVTDFENTGDTRITLRDADPALSYEHGTEQAMLAYADRNDWRNPYVSPIRGDFGRGFPPTLIQVGTKEILLSDSVRLYQAIEAAGGSAKLDVYEGMPHDFQAWWPTSPEGKLALSKVKSFLEMHLGHAGN
jgi:acetyl esterase/lipase